LHSLQETYIKNGLAQAHISEAQIAGVGPKLKERLALHGITNAANINPATLGSVAGFGEAKKQAVLTWRNSIYSRLNQAKPMALAPEQAGAIQHKFETKHAANDAAEREAGARKLTLDSELNALRPRLRELSPLTFRNYLWQIFSAQRVVAGLMAAALVISQICLLSSASMGALAISIPTATLTPTVDVNAMQTATTQASDDQATQTAPALPTATPLATITLTETLTPVLPAVTNTLVPADTDTPEPTNAPLPTATTAGAAPSQELVSLTSPVSPGAYATISVRTNPGASCSITVYYKSGPSKAQGLTPGAADDKGLCSWTWKVGPRTTPGTWSISVTTGGVTQRYPFIVQ
jgi:hypothetical protein